MAIALLLACPSVLARKPIKLMDPPPVPIPAQRTAAEVQDDIKAAFGKNEWYLLAEQPGHMTMRMVDGLDTAKVDVNYDEQTINIQYLDSEDLDYEVVEGERRIHPHYNRWVAAVASDLASYLANGIPVSVDASARRAEKMAIVTVADDKEVPFLIGHISEKLRIGAVDGSRLLFVRDEAVLESGKHRIDFVYRFTNKEAGARLWLVAKPGGHYTAQFQSDGKLVRVVLIDDATGLETGGIQGSDDEPEKPQ